MCRWKFNQVAITQFSIVASLDNNRLVNKDRKSGKSEKKSLLVTSLEKLENNRLFIHILDEKAGLFS